MSDILLRPIVAMQVAVHRLREREDGQTTTEYAILLGFLAIAIIIALFFLRNVLRSLFSSAASSVSRAPGLGPTGSRHDGNGLPRAGRFAFAPGPAPPYEGFDGLDRTRLLAGCHSGSNHESVITPADVRRAVVYPGAERPFNRRRLHMSDILLRPIIAMQVAVHQLREREDGQTTTEYAILLGFLAIAIIIALFFLQERAAQPLLERSQLRFAGTGLSPAGRRLRTARRLGGPFRLV